MYKNYDECVRFFISNMETNGLSGNSSESYSRTFRLFRESMEKHGFTEPCAAAVVSFKEDKKNIKLTSLNTYMTHLRLLSDFGVEEHYWNESFVAARLMPSRKKIANIKNQPYEHILDEEKIVKLVSADRPVTGRKPRTWVREKAEVTLFLQSGLRNSELRALCMSDLDFESGLIFARETKGDKPRYVAFPKLAQAAVKAYLDSDIRPHDLAPDAPVFGCVDKKTGEWKGFERKALAKLIHHYVGSVLGEDDACYSHALRHAYASVLLEHGANMQAISESMGHSSVETTTIYAKRFKAETPAQAIGSMLDNLAIG